MKDPLIQYNVRLRKKQHLGKIARLSKGKRGRAKVIRQAIDAYNPKI